jgi:hypothetical protein
MMIIPWQKGFRQESPPKHSTRICACTKQYKEGFVFPPDIPVPIKVTLPLSGFHGFQAENVPIEAQNTGRIRGAHASFIADSVPFSTVFFPS